ncbi:protein TRI1-like [Salvia splendens]|uniref:protein TRI1-like n=1 Tax=Salvia splendens TaxID=180675 RepID=UPI001C279471|nr:protein TRI1-like [Salvia splendens]XP_042004680.1 protein TRI1-like [Salvia splendens]
MALSLGVCSTFLPRETVSFGNSSSPLSLKLAPANLRVSRSVSITAAAKPATKMKKREPRGIMKPRSVSPDMQAFLGGATEFPRTQVLEEIWAYIKQHNLQDPVDKKVIVCDEKLKKIFGGKDHVGFLEIAGLLNPHFL